MADPLTSEEMAAGLMPTSTPAAPTAPTPTPPAPAVIPTASTTAPTAAAAATPRKPLTSAEMAAGLIPQNAGDMGGWEAFGRSLYKHGTFGVQPFADPTKAEQAAQQHPYLDMLAGAGAMIGQTAALGPISGALKGVKAASALGSLARGTGKALEFGLLPNKEAAGFLGTGRTAAKLAANYTGLEALGSGITDPNKTMGDVAKDVAGNMLVAAPTGFVLGMGAHGLGKVAGAGLNKMFPALPELSAEAAADPAAAGARILLKAGAFDKYTPEMLQAIRDDITANPAKYEDKNIYEALQTGTLQPDPNTGELLPQGKVAPNLHNTIRDYAEVPGEGRTDVVTANTRRNNEMSGKIAAEIDQHFGPASTANIDDLPDLVHQNFGTGNEELDQQITEAIKRQFRQRYGRMSNQPDQYIPFNERLSSAAQHIPTMRAAMEYAARNNYIRDLEGVAGPTNDLRPWNLDDLTKGHVLSADNILDIQHYLSEASRVPPGARQTPETVNLQKLKALYSDWVDDALRGNQQLRTDYALFKKSLEASDQGTGLGINTGGSNHESLQFLRQAVADRDAAHQRVADIERRFTEAWGRYQAYMRRGGTGPAMPGERTTAPNPNHSQFGYGQAILTRDGHDRIVDAWSKAWAKKNFIDPINATNDPGDVEALVHKALTPEGLSRIRLALGNTQSEGFINQLHNLEARRMGRSLGINSGDNDDAAKTFYNRMRQEGRQDAMDAFTRGWGDNIKSQLARSPTEGQGAKGTINRLLTREGKERILRYLGPDRGRQFIESLYSKQQQLKFNQTLYGGPDTAYKLQRIETMKAGLNALKHFASPMHFHPMQSLRDLGELASINYMQNRANQVNSLVARQGPEALGNVLDSILAAERARTRGVPARTAFVRSIGPAGLTGTNLINSSLPAPYSPTQKRPGEASGGWVWRLGEKP